MSNDKNFIKNLAIPFKDEAGRAGLKENLTDCCQDPVLFQMRDNYHEFSMGLFPILQCLKLAEQEGHIPPLGDEWWISIRSRYHIKL